jgi:hypothetical protein
MSPGTCRNLLISSRGLMNLTAQNA